jgi:hypothetical protein
MALFDQAVNAAIGLSSAKLSGRVGLAANVVENLIRRVTTLQGNSTFQPRGKPGIRDPLAAGRARSDPLMSTNWFCDLQPIDDARLGWEFVEEATLPFIEFEQVSNYRAGKMYHYAHQHSLGTLQLKLYEDSSGSATRYLDRWRRRIADPSSGLYNHARDYKQIVKFTILDVAKQTVMFVEYSGCWPTRPDPIQLNSGSADRIVCGVELSVDEMTVKFGKFDSGMVPSIIDHVGVDFPAILSKLPSQFPDRFANVSLSSLGGLAGSVRSII